MTVNLHLNWMKLDDPSEAPNAPGIYLFCLKDFGGIPFYIGTAGEKENSSLKTRMKENDKYFANNKRTYLTDSFFAESASPDKSGFIFQWNKAIQSTTKYLFIPETQDFTPNTQNSINFWKSRLTKYYCTIALVNLDRDKLRSIEANLQTTIRENFYKGIDARIPHTKSLFLGQTNKSDLESGKELVITCSGTGWLSENWSTIRDGSRGD